jgi:hypothetical protein
VLPARDPHQRLAARLAIDRALELDEQRHERWRRELVDDVLHGLVQLHNAIHGAPEG